MEKKTRDSNIELLRIILMLMIIMHHLIVHGCGISFLSKDELPAIDNIPVFLFINSFLILAVNTYIFISAYYGIKFSLKSLISFILQASFYSVTIYLISCYANYDSWSIPSLYRAFIPIISGKWWFLSGYILLFILSPILNIGLDSLKKRHHLFIMIALIVIAASYYITNFNPDSSRVNISTIGLFLTIYVCGRYFRKYPLNTSRPFLWYIGLSLLLFVLVFGYFKFISYQLAWNLFGYTNPIIIAASVCLFYAFKKVNIKSQFINNVSVLTFGIYLLHDADPVRRFITSQMQNLHTLNTIPLLFSILGIAIIIFTICACIEKIRQIVFSPILNSIVNNDFIKRINL